MKNKIIVLLKKIRNAVRNFILFRIIYPGVKYGSDVTCQWSAFFWKRRNSVFIGNRVGIGRECYFQANVRIGDNVLIAGRAAFLNSDDHRYDIVGKRMWDSGRGDRGEIIVEDDVWIGFGAIIMAPAYISRGSIVGAGSVVRGTVEPYSIVAGVPARLIKRRFTVDEVLKHESILAGES